MSSGDNPANALDISTEHHCHLHKDKRGKWWALVCKWYILPIHFFYVTSFSFAMIYYLSNDQ